MKKEEKKKMGEYKSEKEKDLIRNPALVVAAMKKVEERNEKG